MAQEWDIKPRGDACHACETPFQDRQTYFATLVFGEEGYERADYCEGCWESRGREDTPYSTWQGTFILPPPEPEEALKKETAESCLRRLMEDEDDKNRNVIYILAVMLERKRILAEKDVRKRDDGVLIRVYEHRKTGETFLVPDPQLRLDQLEHVQQEVVTMLGSPAKPKGDTGQGGQEEQPEEAADRPLTADPETGADAAPAQDASRVPGDRPG
jgi:hypothetical protein